MFGTQIKDQGHFRKQPVENEFIDKRKTRYYVQTKISRKISAMIRMMNKQ